LSTKTGIWYVKNFVDVHNHALAEPESMFMCCGRTGD
jgi:hypothetical protein